MSESSAPSDHQRIRACFDAIRQEREQLNTELNASFSEFDALHKQLERHRDQLNEEREELERKRESLETARQLQLEDLDTQQQEQAKRLEAAESQLNAVRKEAAAAETSAAERALTLESALATARQTITELETATSATDAEVEQRWQQLTAERDRFEHDLADSQTRVAQLEKSLETLARAQDALATLEDTTSDAQNRETSQEDWEIAIREVALHKQQVSQLQSERDALEQELDTVRVRACELSDTVSMTKRQMAEQQAQWAIELKTMRQVLEQQAETLSAGRAAAPVEHPASDNDNPLTPEAHIGRTGDQVVGNVMAQFDKLRQQRVKRCTEQHVDTKLHRDCG